MQMLVTRTQKLGFTDEKTGNKISGVTIEYVSLEKSDSPDKRGNPFAKTFIPDDMSPFDWFPVVPAMYEMEFGFGVGRGGRVAAKLVGAKLIAELGEASD